ncbi:MAG: hypothetical protein N0E54_00615 [Candidatus Thiodiazotropha taylori]|nr:hypothetical protein [Candidatus Thiodiazotropha endolucinida]MCW4227219.1 hypothetical protein [Candidatus Thiodiazotropha taylori]
MTPKQVILGSSIFLLAIANIMYWLPDETSANKYKYDVSHKRTASISLDTFPALEVNPRSEYIVKRDLFSPVAPKKVAQDKPIIEKPILPRVKKAAPKKKNQIKPPDLLLNYRLAGLAVRSGKRVAYLLDGETTHVAYAGDNLTQSVAVESIGEHTAIIKDLQTGLTRKLLLAGE